MLDVVLLDNHLINKVDKKQFFISQIIKTMKISFKITRFKTFCILFLLIPICLLNSCSEPESLDTLIIGEWKCIYKKNTTSKQTKKVKCDERLVFNENGKLIQYFDSDTFMELDYLLKDSVLIKIGNQEYGYYLKKDTLVIEIYNELFNDLESKVYVK